MVYCILYIGDIPTTSIESPFLSSFFAPLLSSSSNTTADRQKNEIYSPTIHIITTPYFYKAITGQ